MGGWDRNVPMKASDYVMLPWSIRGPFLCEEPGGSRYEMRIAELPDFVVSANSVAAALYEFKRALLTFIENALRHGVTVPRPSGPPVHYSVPPRLKATVPTKAAGVQTGSATTTASVKL
jgi:hypothetical protein